jgi:tetratricopeptide (TPR) repeat protein
MNPEFVIAHIRLRYCYERKGAYDEAIAESQKIFDLGARSLGTAELAQAYAMAGKRTEAEKKLAELQELSKQQYVSPALFASIYAALGEKDQAFDWLNKSIDEHGLDTGRLKVDMRFDNLRSDPRFTELLKRVGLPE